MYLLLWNMRLGHEHAGLHFWLNSISVHAAKAPILIVGTHLDLVRLADNGAANVKLLKSGRV